jgi:hypothetical protein
VIYDLQQGAFSFATVPCKDLAFCHQRNWTLPQFSLLIPSSVVPNIYHSHGCFTLVSMFKKLKVGRSLGTRAVIEALKSSDDGEFLELSSQIEHIFSDCSK